MRYPGEIRAQIERTRSEMGETVEAIERILSTARLTDRIYKKILEFTSRGTKKMTYSAKEQVLKAGSGAARMIREHPIAAALAGIGLGWLIAGALRGSNKSGEGRHAEESYFQAGELYQKAIPRKEEEVPSLTAEKAGAAKENLERAATEISKKTTWRSRAFDYLDKIGESTQSRIRETSGRLRRIIDSNPLAALAAALTLGAAIGFSIPGRSHQADEP
ncbi:MAG: DUF3618 domain-containing protein [Syntrophales bacterium]